MSSPNFSPITQQRKSPGSGSSGRKSQQAAAAALQSSGGDASRKPKYQCPGCGEIFSKWSPCLSHLREKQCVDADLLDKRKNGGDFRRVQEMCATLAYYQRSNGTAAGRERTDSNSSVDSLSSDSGGEEDADSHSSSTKMGGGKHSRFIPVASSLPLHSQVKALSPRAVSSPSSRPRVVRSLRDFEEKIISRILAFLDIETANNLFHTMAPPPPVPDRVASPMEGSRVRLWSNSSDPDSISLPSASPPTLSKGTAAVAYSRGRSYHHSG